MKRLIWPLSVNFTSQNLHYSPGQLALSWAPERPARSRRHRTESHPLLPSMSSKVPSKLLAKLHQHHLCERHQKSHMLNDCTYMTLRDRQDYGCQQKSEQLPLGWEAEGRTAGHYTVSWFGCRLHVCLVDKNSLSFNNIYKETHTKKQKQW